MQISRCFTREGQDPFAGIEFAPRTSSIRNPSGSVVFEMTDVMVPAKWSQVAVNILAQKCFRGAFSKTLAEFEIFHGIVNGFKSI